jgi:hypothetical protein
MLHASGITEAINQGGGGLANGTYQYVPDPNATENLVFHGHVFVAVYGGEIESGNAGAGDTIIAAAQANGIGYQVDLPDGGNLHIHYIVPLDNPSSFSLNLFAGVVNDPGNAFSNEEGAFATFQGHGTASAWGYVTVVGEDLSPGDFNGDGLVDGEDFEIWESGGPQADADEDGDIDDDDLSVWVENTTELVVSTEIDEVDTDYSLGDLSLREAITLAGDTNHPGHDVIYFAPWVNEIVLTGGAISLNFTESLSFEGLGADRLTINADHASYSIFTASMGSPPSSTVTVHGIKLVGANSTAISVYSGPSLILDAVEITGNGGGVYYSYGWTNSLTISNSTIAENTGQAVSVSFSPAYVFNTTISDNQTVGPITAGLSAAYSSVELTNVTITNNRSDKNKTTGTSFAIAGLNANSVATIVVHNTIVVGNFSGATTNSVPADIGRLGGTFSSSSSHNLIGSSPSGAFPTGNNNQLGVTVATAGLLALADNGGPVRTHAILSTGLAVDAGDNTKAIALGLIFDERGSGYGRIFDGDFDLDGIVDIGAFELAWQDF